MITSIQNRATMGRALTFCLTLVALVLLAAPPAAAAAPSGKASAWGYNEFGQLGNGNSGIDSNVPVAVKKLTGIKSVKAGCYHGLALLQDGTVYAWGLGLSGQVGNGTTDASDVPVKVKKLTDVKAISAGCSHSLALKENGSVWAWGSNSHGQLGNGTSGAGTESNVPVKVASLGTGAKAIAAGNSFSLALMKDGTVNSWGSNDTGQLGNGTYTPRNTPGPVSNLSGVKAIATDSSGHHVLALLQDGTVESWGYNADGQVGDGTTGAPRLTPVAVGNLTGVKAIATGGYHSLALLESGKVKSWGWNYYGQLGNANSTSRSTPGGVFGLSNVKSIAGGGGHSLAVLESGEARSWGQNGDGQLGIGTAGDSVNVPVAVKNLTNVKNIDGGHEFTLAATQ